MRKFSLHLVLAVIAATQAASAEVEKPSALNATALTAIAPTYNGTGGTTSFIRLFNLDPAVKGDFAITVIGSPSGNTYGSTTISVPAMASPQYALSAILTAAGAGALTGGDDSYTLYVRNPNPSAAYQHVIFNSNNGFFENVTACVFFQGAVYKGLPQTLANVHTTQLANYPSRVQVHNQADTAVTYRASIYDAASGTLIGKVDLPMGANTTTTFPESYFEQQLKWTPTSSQLHVNMVFEQVNANPQDAFYATIGQVIFNSTLNASISMTTLCRVQH